MGYPGPENQPKDTLDALTVPRKRDVDLDAPKESCSDVLRRWFRAVPEAGLVYGAGMALVLTIIALMWVPVYGYSRADALGFVRALHDNWRAFVILSAPLLYGPVKKFVDEAEEAFGVKRARPPISTTDKTGGVGQIREQRQRDEE